MINDEILLEKIEVLLGDRPKARGRSAVVKDDLSEFSQIRKLSQTVGAAPTQAEHNALVYDVHNIIDALNDLAARLAK